MNGPVNAPGLVVSELHATAALRDEAERHLWWMTAFGVLTVCGGALLLVALWWLATGSHPPLLSAFLRGGAAIGMGAAFASLRRRDHTRELRRAVEAVEMGARVRLNHGLLEIDGAVPQRLRLPVAAAAKLTAAIMPPARVVPK